MSAKFTSVTIKNFKAFRMYSLHLSEFNVLVGKNNAGKSTVLSAFRILFEGIRKARTRNPSLIMGPEGNAYGHFISLEPIPIATDNVFNDYDDSNPAEVRFKLSNGNELILFFPENRVCHLLFKNEGRPTTSTILFKKNFPVSIGIVPILGPVEDKEPLFQEEAARLALLSHGASRNFRNIWHHYPEGFETFSTTLTQYWDGMEISKPEIVHDEGKPYLKMYCKENRITREIYWTGFGFQVYCQLLTNIVKSKDSSLIIIDEPDIYLHSDLQKHLVHVLKSIGPDIIIATHSLDIISEVDTENLLLIDKANRHARRIRTNDQLSKVFSILGTNLNPVITQVTKNKKVLFVEGMDFKIISAFARKLERKEIANQSDFAVIQVEGFNDQKIKNLIEGIEATIGGRIESGAILDKDYRSSFECQDVSQFLNSICKFCLIHNSKEIENYLILPEAIKRAITNRIKEREKRGEAITAFEEDISQVLNSISATYKSQVFSQILAKWPPFYRKRHPGIDDATINKKIMEEFDVKWSNPIERMRLIPGKQFLSSLNEYLQPTYHISLTPFQILQHMNQGEIPPEVISMVEKIDELRKRQG